jgi:hypothetical protein
VQIKLLEVFMKKRLAPVIVMVLALAITFVVIGCASGPKLGQPTDLQKVLNAFPAIPIAGKDLKFEFGGDIWIAKVSGKEFLAGTFTSVDTDEGSNLELKQNYAYSSEQKPGIGGDVGWIKTPGPSINLEYKEGPPSSLSVK